MPVESVLHVDAAKETTAVEGNLNGQLGVATIQFLVPQVWVKCLVIPVKNGRKETSINDNKHLLNSPVLYWSKVQLSQGGSWPYILLTLRGSCVSSAPVCPGPSGQQHEHLVCQTAFPGSWGCH